MRYIPLTDGYPLLTNLSYATANNKFGNNSELLISIYTFAAR